MFEQFISEQEALNDLWSLQQEDDQFVYLFMQDLDLPPME